MPRREPDLSPGGSLYHPLELAEVARRFVVGPPRRGPLVDASLELSGLGLLLAANEPRVVGELELHLDVTHRLALDRLLCDARRQPPGVLQHEPDEERGLPQPLDVERADLEEWRDEQVKERPVGMRSDLRLQLVEGDVEPVVDDVPPAELDLPELGMVELVPLDVR